MCHTSVIHLFGPVDMQAALTQTVKGDQFYWPGSCDTSHIAVFQPQWYGPNPIKWATLRIAVSQPSRNYVFRAVSCTDGPANIAELGRINTSDMPAGVAVWNGAVDITAALNAFFAAYPCPDANVGFQVKGDGTNPFTLFSARLDITWA
jgi:hypothetical protein